MTGMGLLAVISFRARAASMSGTAQRMMSQPRSASFRIWASVAAASWVFVLVMDWTAIGASPPIFTPPTWI